MYSFKQSQSGFTLIEMIVSLAVFSVVMTISIGALLALIATNEQLQSEQSVLTNITFALDSMTREIRTGTNYFCESKNNYNGNHAGGIDNMFDDTDMDAEIGDTVRDCSGGREMMRLQGISFVESGNSITGVTRERILYFFDEDEGNIYRRVGTEEKQSIVSSGIVIEDMEFYVSGSAPLSGSGSSLEDQPIVTIYIQASEEGNPSKKYNIQTTITQRILDI